MSQASHNQQFLVLLFQDAGNDAEGTGGRIV